MPDSSLSTGVTLAVLAAALLHAAWNALIRGAGDKALYTLLLHLCTASLGLLGLMFTGLPAPASLPDLGASALVHTVYILWLIHAYEGGSLAFSYALMRGLPPLLIALVSAPLLGEALGATAAVGIGCICVGILAIGFANGQARHRAFFSPAARAALLNAVAIAAYTAIDGQGARLSGNPVAYALLLCALEPIIVLALRLRRDAGPTLAYFRKHWRLGLLGGLCSITAYATVLWAMTRAPIAMVAALRESAVIFAVLIGSLWFREGRLAIGLAASCALVAGLVLLRS